MTWLDELAEKSLARERPARAEALNVLNSTDDELMDVVAAAFRVRLHYFGRRVKLNYLVNIKSGLCPEDCFYCSQRLGSAADVLKYTWLKPDEVLKNAEAGVQAGAERVCLVASGRGPNDADITRVSTAIKEFKAKNPDVEVCACLGLLADGQAERLHEAGTTAYNHNLNTAEANYTDICSTHTFGDRAETVRKPRPAACPALGPDRRDGRDRRRADRRGVRAARPGPRLGPGQLPDPVRGHPARRRVEPHPSAACASWPWSGSSARTPRSGWPAGARSTCAACSRSRCTSSTRSSWATT